MDKIAVPESSHAATVGPRLAGLGVPTGIVVGTGAVVVGTGVLVIGEDVGGSVQRPQVSAHSCAAFELLSRAQYLAFRSLVFTHEQG